MAGYSRPDLWRGNGAYIGCGVASLSAEGPRCDLLRDQWRSAVVLLSADYLAGFGDCLAGKIGDVGGTIRM